MSGVILNDEQAALIRDLADRLIKTLGGMDAARADAVVNDVATSMYRALLGEKGYISAKSSAMMCGSRGCQRLADYEWKRL